MCFYFTRKLVYRGNGLLERSRRRFFYHRELASCKPRFDAWRVLARSSEHAARTGRRALPRPLGSGPVPPNYYPGGHSFAARVRDLHARARLPGKTDGTIITFKRRGRPCPTNVRHRRRYLFAMPVAELRLPLLTRPPPPPLPRSP